MQHHPLVVLACSITRITPCLAPGKGGSGPQRKKPHSELQSKERLLKDRKKKQKMQEVQSKRRAKKARLSRKSGKR